jgi:hypothetical protein
MLRRHLYPAMAAAEMREQFSLPHPCLERSQAQGSVRLITHACEESRQLVIFEVRRFLPLRTGPLCRR